MNLQQVEYEALHLPFEERAELVQKILVSLDSPPEGDFSEDWLFEAKVRRTGLRHCSANNS